MTRHPLTATLERATNASEALRALLLADAHPAERDLIDGTLRALGETFRQVPWRTPAIRRAANRLACAVDAE